MLPIRITKSLETADADGIALSQTTSAAGYLTLNGTFASGSPAVAVLDTARRILITTGSDETAFTATIYGFDKPEGGAQIQETVSLPNNSTVQSVRDFGRVTGVYVDGNLVGNVQVGTSGVGSIPWQLSDYHLDPTNWRISIDVTGTVNYTLQYTDDDFMGAYNAGNGQWEDAYPTKVWDDPVIAAATADAAGFVTNPIVGWRITINSGDGSLRITGTQAGMARN